MKLQQIREALTSYDRQKSVFSLDTKGVNKLRKIVKKHAKDRDDYNLTVKEELKIITILQKATNDTNQNAKSLYKQIEQIGETTPSLMFWLNHAAKESTQNNLLKVQTIKPEYLNNLSHVWGLLNPDLLTQESFDFLLYYAAFLNTKSEYSMDLQMIEDNIIKKI